MAAVTISTTGGWGLGLAGVRAPCLHVSAAGLKTHHSALALDGQMQALYGCGSGLLALPGSGNGLAELYRVPYMVTVNPTPCTSTYVLRPAY